MQINLDHSWEWDERVDRDGQTVKGWGSITNFNQGGIGKTIGEYTWANQSYDAQSALGA